MRFQIFSAEHQSVCSAVVPHPKTPLFFTAMAQLGNDFEGYALFGL